MTDEPTDGVRPVASVIVCTRNRAELLDGCLESLLADRPALPWELIVVDNASTDLTASVIARWREHTREVRVEHIVEERLGHSQARNRGVAAAGGDYLLFTDDDVLVRPGWVDALCLGFGEPDVVAVAGQVLPEWPSPPPRWLAGHHTGVLALTDLGDTARDLAGDELPVGANMAMRASALPSKAPFDPRLGHRGSSRFAFEEYELLLELRRHGRLVYRPDAVVLHCIEPERMTWRGMRRAALHNGFGSRRAERLRGAKPPPVRSGIREMARAYVAARRQSRHNGGRADVEPEAALGELRQYWELGRSIEVTFGDSVPGAWLVSRIAR